MTSIQWKNDANGDFATGSNWVGGAAPGALDDAILSPGGGTPFTVTSSISETVNSIQTTAQATLSIVGSSFTATAGFGKGNVGTIAVGNGASFALAGSLSNTGVVAVDGASSTTALNFLAGASSLNGSGRVTLTDSSANVVGATGVASLVNAGNTISGAGNIGGFSGNLTLTNQAAGIINATGTTNALILGTSNTVTNAGLIETTGKAGMTIDDTVANSGVIEALGSGAMTIARSVINAAGGKVLTVSGSKLVLTGGTITGGSVSVVAGATLVGSGGGVAGAIFTNAGAITIADNHSLNMQGALANKGTVALNGAASSTTLNFLAGASTLSGGGRVTLTDSSANLVGATAAASLVNVDNTISGAGNIGGSSGNLTLNNQAKGIINATGSTNALILATLNTVTNGGLIETTGKAGMTIDDAVANGGFIEALGSGAMTITGALTNSANGEILVRAGATVTFQSGSLTNLSAGELKRGIYVVDAGGTLELPSNSPVTTLSAIMELNGAGSTVQSLNTGKSTEVSLESSLTALSADGDLKVLGARNYSTANSLANSGIVELGGGTLSAAGLIDAAGSLLTGFGTEAATLNSMGVVTAVGGALDFTATGNSFTGAVGGTEIDFVGGTDTLGSGASLTAGTIGLSGAAAVTLSAGQSFAGTWNQGTSSVALGANTLTLTGVGNFNTGAAISGAGTLSLAGGVDTIAAGASITASKLALSGGAAVSLNETLSYAGTLTVAGGTSLTIAAGDTLTLTGTATLAGTINGAGALALASTGVINVTGTPATMAAGAFTNAGTVSLTASGSLSLSGSIKNAGSFSVGAGSTLTLSTATLVASGSSAVLDTALGGAIKISNASTAQITGAEVNAGTIALVSTGSATDLRVTAAGATLTGGGTITLGGSLSRVLGVSTTATLTNVDNTISGAGFVGAKQMTLINQAKGVIDAVGKGSLVVATGGAILNNAGLLEATGGGLLVLTGTTIDQSAGGTILAATGSHVDLSNVDIIGGTVESTGSGVLNVNVSGGVLDGTTSAITLAGLLQLVNGRSLTLEGSIGETGQIHMFGSTLATQLTVAAAGATLSGGGKVNLSNSVNNRIVGVSGAATLTNVNDVIAGSGVLGGGTMTLVNDAGGTILGNASAGLTIDTGANTIVNAGAIDAVNTGVHVTVKSAVDNSGKLFAAGGVLILDGAITGTGSASISGGKLDVVTASFTQNVTFTGATGVLELANSVGYTGTVKGLSLTGTSSLDLVDIGFTSGVTKASYVDNGSKTGGVLTVTDGTHTAHITLAGNYSASVFTTSGDGHGGTTVVDPRTSAFVQAIAGTGAPSSAPSPTAAHDLDRMSQPALVAPRRFSS